VSKLAYRRGILPRPPRRWFLPETRSLLCSGATAPVWMPRLQSCSGCLASSPTAGPCCRLPG